MVPLRCKLCGEDLQITKDASTAKCACCGTTQALPKLSHDRITALHGKANHLRRNKDFDGAMKLYRQILLEDATDAESYWSLMLCRYGIVYEQDRASQKWIPSIHCSQSASVLDDPDYRSAIKYADSARKPLYEAEAKIIEKQQKEILSLAKKEASYDVILCCKEADSYGRKTSDAPLAQDLYELLNKEGFKVFYPPVALDSKPASAWEPCIYKALSSAKVMIVLGTKPEHFQSPEVKHLWNRYLALSKEDTSKALIPAYRDMDPFDLPAEFSGLQLQDMSRLSFAHGLILRIRELAREEARVQTLPIKPVAPEVIYAQAHKLMTEAKTEQDYLEAAKLFERIYGHRDASNLTQHCYIKAQSMHQAAAPAENKRQKSGKKTTDRSSTFKLPSSDQDQNTVAEGTVICKQVPPKELPAPLKSSKKKSLSRRLLPIACALLLFAVAFFFIKQEYSPGKEARQNPDVKFPETISTGSVHTDDLKTDGTVVATGDHTTPHRADIVAIHAGTYHTVGLRSDGTVVATGGNYSGQCDVSGWTDIVAIHAGDRYTVGLKSDGTIVTTG